MTTSTCSSKKDATKEDIKQSISNISLETLSKTLKELHEDESDCDNIEEDNEEIKIMTRDVLPNDS